MAIIVDDVVVSESDPVARFTVRLTEASALPVSVSFNNSNATALNGSDYTLQSGTLTFAPGQTVLFVDIPILNDVTLEREELFALNLFNPVNSTIARNHAWAQIVDNDQPTGVPVVRVGNRVVDEAAGLVLFTIYLDKPSTGSVSVNYATANGTALAGSDYVAQATQTLTFLPGQTARTVSVPLINDGANEGAEYFDLVLSAPVGATLVSQPFGRATIGASDAPAVAVPFISVSDAVADESNTFLEFVVSLSAPSTQTVSVSYNNSNLTALNGSDYQLQSNTLTFLPGETTRTVRIPVLDTAGAEATELLTLNLFNPVNGTIATPFALGTIHDNDQPSGVPIVRVGDRIVDEASGQVVFTIYLDRPSTGNVSVNYATANGTALAGSDYVAQAVQTLTFLPGQVARTVSVALVNDTANEGREYFDLVLSAPVNATLVSQPFGRATIGASDAPAVAVPFISVSDAVADESNTFLEFVVTLSAPSTQAVSVSYNNSNLTALNGSDYQLQSSTLTFIPGETTKTVRIPVLDTAGAEPTELLTLNLFNPVNGTIATPFGLGTIHDNDQPSGVPIVRVGDRIVDEASGQVVFTIYLDRPSTGNVSVNYATANGTALAGSDYVAQAVQTLTFLPGQTARTVSVALVNDTANEGREYFDLVLSAPVNATLVNQPSGRATIGASDAPAVAVPFVSVSDAVADESSAFLEFVVSLSAPSTQAVSVSYNNSNLTALNGSDYQLQSSTLTFIPGETTKTVRIPVLDTAGAERHPEVMTLNLFNPVNATVVTPFAIGAIHDNDQPSGVPVIRVGDRIVDEASGQVAITVTLDRPSTGNVSVSYATANGSALAGSDYVAQALRTLTFLPGETARTISVALTNDTQNEPGEFFDLVLSAPVGATLPDPNARIFIGASDAPALAVPLISASEAVADESATFLEFVVSLNAPSTQNVSVSYNNSNLTALNGSDYQLQSDTLTFVAGETTKVVRIPVLDTAGAEPIELLTLNLFNPVNGTIVTPFVLGTIHDNDQPSGVPVLSVSDGIADESAPRATFTVSLDRPSTSQVTVAYATANGNALAGSDYEAQGTQTLVFAPGETAKTVTVNLRPDAANETADVFDLVLSSAVNATIGDPRGHMVIAQSDAAPAALPSIAATAIAAREGGTFLEFVVSLSAPSTQLVSVGYNNSNGTALNGSDYQLQSSTLLFAPGETLRLVRIPLLANAVAEPTETFTLNLFNAVNASITTPATVGTILDDDGAAPPNFTNLGTTNADVLVGRPGANAVSGGDGNDLLDGVDGVQMTGGAGNDVYIVESAADVVAPEAAGAGTDTVISYLASFTLAANFENLVLGAGAGDGTGNALANTILGNTLVNTLAGGLGNDVYGVDNAGDVVIEAAGAGTDTVQASVTIAALAANVENLVLVGTAAINGTGNALNNTVTGNTANNVLNGGQGVDTLIGGLGNDTYVVDTLTDVITEAAAGGTDTVQASLTFTLGATSNLENLTLTGALAINGTGNALNNVLTGNTAANVLTGEAGNDTLNGGAGIDTLVGGLGNDTYVVDTTTDVITEAVGAGIDTVQSSVTFVLAADSNLENLTLTGALAIDGTGNALDNILVGNTAANALSGGAGNDTLRGGGGPDTLTGGTGGDTFDYDLVADSGPGAALRDTVTDFISGVDRFDFSTIDAIAGTASNDAFASIGTAAFSAAGQLRYAFDGVNTLVQGNVGGTNGNAADFEILVAGNHQFPPGTGDFIL